MATDSNNKSFHYSDFQNHHQIKSNLHFSFCQSQIWKTKYFAPGHPVGAKGRSILFNHFIDILLKFSNKNTFFLHEMDKLTVVLMSIKWLNKIERPLDTFYNYIW